MTLNGAPKIITLLRGSPIVWENPAAAFPLQFLMEWAVAAG
jgi:hypothetical protein